MVIAQRSEFLKLLTRFYFLFSKEKKKIYTLRIKKKRTNKNQQEPTRIDNKQQQTKKSVREINE